MPKDFNETLAWAKSNTSLVKTELDKTDGMWLGGTFLVTVIIIFVMLYAGSAASAATIKGNPNTIPSSSGNTIPTGGSAANQPGQTAPQGGQQPGQTRPQGGQPGQTIENNPRSARGSSTGSSGSSGRSSSRAPPSGSSSRGTSNRPDSRSDDLSDHSEEDSYDSGSRRRGGSRAASPRRGSSGQRGGSRRNDRDNRDDDNNSGDENEF